MDFKMLKAKMNPMYKLVKPAIELQQRFQKGETIPILEVDSTLEKLQETHDNLVMGSEFTRIGHQNRDHIKGVAARMEVLIKQMRDDLSNNKKFVKMKDSYTAVVSIE